MTKLDRELRRVSVNPSILLIEHAPGVAPRKLAKWPDDFDTTDLNTLIDGGIVYRGSRNRPISYYEASKF